MSAEKQKWHKGGCHCGDISFRILAPVTITALECNCSICYKTGFQHVFVDKENFELLTGAEKMATYSFGTHTAKHYFCLSCGIKSYYIPRSHPDQFSVNMRCLDQSNFESVKLAPFDGANWEENVGAIQG